MELIEYNGKKLANARMIHKDLGIKFAFSTWIKSNIETNYLDEDKDFIRLAKESTGGRPSVEYLLTKDAALCIVATSRGVKAKEVRLELVKAFEEKQTGISLTVEQVTALTEMVKAMTLVSVQKNAEKKHFNYLGRPKDWWEYRAKLLGYSAQSLKDALIKVGKKYKSQKQALIHIDPAEIIRTGVVDLLKALGRDDIYSLNIGEWAKAIAKSNGYHFQIWDDTKPNPLGIGMKEIIERQEIGRNYLKDNTNTAIK